MNKNACKHRCIRELPVWSWTGTPRLEHVCSHCLKTVQVSEQHTVWRALAACSCILAATAIAGVATVFFFTLLNAL